MATLSGRTPAGRAAPRRRRPEPACDHLGVPPAVDPASDVCDACVALGDGWIHLRGCLACGSVGCCDNSPNRHARRHYEATGHPVMRSIEPGEAWRWCWVDGVGED